MIILKGLLLGAVVSACFSMVGSSLISAAVGLALSSLFISVVLYLIGGPLAAVFELSVCAGLITVVFMSAISLTTRVDEQEEKVRVRDHFKRFLPLPILCIVVYLLLMFLPLNLDSVMVASSNAVDSSVQETLWNSRRLDLIGQIALILSGVLGVVVLFKEFAPERKKIGAKE